MSQNAPTGGGPNKFFLTLAIGLAALLVIGLVGVVGVLAIPRIVGAGTTTQAGLRVAAVAQVATPTPFLASGGGMLQASPTAGALSGAGTVTPTIVGGAGTVTPTIIGGGGTVTPTIIGGAGTSTPTPATPGGQLPQSGLGEDLLLMAGGVVLVLVIFAARRARTV